MEISGNFKGVFLIMIIWGIGKVSGNFVKFQEISEAFSQLCSFLLSFGNLRNLQELIVSQCIQRQHSSKKRYFKNMLTNSLIQLEYTNHTLLHKTPRRVESYLISNSRTC